MASAEIPQVYKTDAAAHPYTTMEQHIFTLPNLSPLTEEQKGMMKSIMFGTAIVIIATIGILIQILKRCRYSSLLVQS